MKEIEFKINITSYPNGIIEQAIFDGDIENMGKVISKQIADTQEKGFRKSLQSMGWITPEDSKRLINEFYRCLNDDTNFGIYSLINIIKDIEEAAK